MKVLYKNQQDKSDPMNGAVITEGAKLVELLDSCRNDPPFFARFSGDNGFKIMVGIGRDVGCIQYSRSDGEPPYLVALSVDCPTNGKDVEFWTGGTATPIPARFILSSDELKQIALHFLETGERSDAVFWESI
jgi:hypothetical protein